MDGYVEANSIKLHYLEHDGDEPTLILLHGLTANAHYFDGLVAAGLSPRFRTLVPDLRGRGLSDKPLSGYSMADHGADIMGLLDTFKIEQAVLVGHSYGALLCLYMAAKYPERIKKIVLMDASESATEPQVAELIKPSLDRLNRILPSYEAYQEEMKQMPFLQGQWDKAIESFYRADVKLNEDGTAQSQIRPDSIAETIEGVISEPWMEIVNSVKQPAVLLNAPAAYVPGGPAVVPAEAAKKTAADLDNCRYLEVPGNHITMAFGANAATVVAAITEFVAGD